MPGTLLAAILPQVVGSMHLSSPVLENADPGPPESRTFPGGPKVCAQGSGEDLTLDGVCGGNLGPIQKAQHAGSSQSTSHVSSEQFHPWSILCAEGAGGRHTRALAQCQRTHRCQCSQRLQHPGWDTHKGALDRSCR